MKILPTNNEFWGFWATAGENGLDRDLAWAEASTWLQEVYGLSAVDARNYLDAKEGRHLADALTHKTLAGISESWAGYMKKSTAGIVANRAEFAA